MCSVLNHPVRYELFHLISFLVRKFSVNGQFLQLFGDSSEKIPHQEIILRSERIVIVSKKSIFDLLYSCTHLVHSFVAETHCKL